MTDWSTWLIFPAEGADAVTRDRIASLGRFAHVDLSARPRAALESHDGVASLYADDLDAFFGRCARGKTLLAFSTAPIEELEQIDGTVFLHGAQHYICRWLGATNSTAEFDPYLQRFVRFERGGVRAEDSLNEAGRPRAQTSPPSGHPRGRELLLAPAKFTLTDLELTEFLGDSARALGQLNCVMLPPWREDDLPDYFFENRIRDRERIRSGLSGDHATDLPCSLVVQEWMDHRSLRPFLIEGGSFGLAHEDGSPTGVSLRVVCEGSIPSYRSTLVLDPDPSRFGGLRAEIFGRLREDIRKITHPRLSFVVAESIRDWSVPNVLPTAPLENPRVWSSLSGLSDLLDEAGRRRFAHRVVLAATRGRGIDVNVGVESFIVNYMASPDIERQTDHSWRIAVDTLLSANPRFSEGPHESSALQLDKQQGVTLSVADERRWDVICNDSVATNLIMAIRLLAPLDSVVRRSGKSLLDESAILDQSFTLA